MKSKSVSVIGIFNTYAKEENESEYEIIIFDDKLLKLAKKISPGSLKICGYHDAFGIKFNLKR